MPKDQVIYIGDYRYDVDCARAAGVRVALYTGLSRDAEDYGADFVFSDYREFFNILPGLDF